uniref:hypothetical protein n=1 Tax=Polaromonas sp. H6N TaxID=1840293 RepID=UPI0015E82B1C|nr:hypothetical protein [Polaromonas sp. H6N]
MKPSTLALPQLDDATDAGDYLAPILRKSQDGCQVSSLALCIVPQAEASKEAQRAGINQVKAGAAKVYLGRKPSYTETQISEVVALTTIARE